MAFKYEIMSGVLTPAEANDLKSYLAPLLENGVSENGIRSYVLSNRPDAWDRGGYIERGLIYSSSHFQKLIFPNPLDRVGFLVREIGQGANLEPSVDLDTSRDAQVHEINRKMAVLVLNDDYEGGDTVFPNWGESFKPKAGDLILYDVFEDNRVGIEQVTSGSRIEVVYTYMEIITKTRFDEFYMPPMENDSDRF